MLTYDGMQDSAERRSAVSESATLPPYSVSRKSWDVYVGSCMKKKLSAIKRREATKEVIYPKIDQPKKGYYTFDQALLRMTYVDQAAYISLQLVFAAPILSWLPTITTAYYTSLLICHTTMVAIQFKLLGLIALCTLASCTVVERVSVYALCSSRH